MKFDEEDLGCITWLLLIILILSGQWICSVILICAMFVVNYIHDRKQHHDKD